MNVNRVFFVNLNWKVMLMNILVGMEVVQLRFNDILIIFGLVLFSDFVEECWKYFVFIWLFFYE